MDNRISEMEKKIKDLNDQNWVLEWRFNHARNQYHAFIEEVIPLVDTDKLGQIFQNLGRNCAKSLGWAEKYKGDPEGFFKHMNRKMGETISISEDRKKIIVDTGERPCACPIMKDKYSGGVYCDCSLGWQMETYETILGKKVDVVLKEACFRGSGRCLFEINVSDQDIVQE